MQILKKEGRLLEYVIAFVGGGSNAIGAFLNVAEEKSIRLGQKQLDMAWTPNQHAATMIERDYPVVVDG